MFPFIKFPGVDVLLGPEMKSTGEVMGIDRDFRKAYVKSQIAAGSPLPTSGKVFVSVKNRDKRAALGIAKRLAEMGFTPGGHRGHRQAPRAAGHDGRDDPQGGRGLPAQHRRPHEARARSRWSSIPRGRPRAARLVPSSGAPRCTQNIPYYTTVDGAQAALGGIEALLKGEISVQPLQEYHAAALPSDRLLAAQRLPPRSADRRSRRGEPGPGGALIDRLDGLVSRYKIGSQLFTAAGPAAVEAVHKRGAEVFLDLKFHDIPNTVAGAAREATRARRLHVQRPRLRRARHDAAAAAERGEAAAGELGVRRPARRSRSPCSPASTAPPCTGSWAWPPRWRGTCSASAELAREAGLDGNVASPREIAAIRRTRSARAWVIVTPGVRPAGAAPATSRASATPGAAGPRGRALPRGRPAHHGARRDPARAAEAILGEMDG